MPWFVFTHRRLYEVELVVHGPVVDTGYFESCPTCCRLPTGIWRGAPGGTMSGAPCTHSVGAPLWCLVYRRGLRS